LTFHAQSMGRFDDALRKLLGRPQVEVGAALGRLHTRLLTCQIDSEDVPALRDNVLIPALSDEVTKAAPVASRIEELLSLLVLVPEPKPSDDGSDDSARKAWLAAVSKARDVMKDQFGKAYNVRRAYADGLRKNPPPTLRKGMFCTAAELSAPDGFGED
jgi:hypothetical protein